ncbi:diguanylate cyclase (GGDEF) domain-containing protein [Azospirillum sp. RU38E]|nr:diguanylate cyclase (GGDEF) domain-containing protein [Azospirillum sp. RU38E]SNS82424.1 diguanylate cyclase (GGDEF) domain-containing protein [Azospirillum sp. RU37A]
MVTPPDPVSLSDGQPAASSWPGLMDHIQPHGWLLVLQGDDLRIIQASANVELLAGQPLAAILGQPVRAVIGRAAANLLGRALSKAEPDGLGPLPVTVVSGRGRHRVAMQGHWDAGGFVLELEPLSMGNAANGAINGFGTAIRRYRHISDVAALSAAITHDARLLTGFDRALMVRLAGAAPPEVVAVSCASAAVEDGPPFQPLPPSILALLELNRVRLLLDIHAPPVPVLPVLNPVTGQPINLSRAALRPATRLFEAHARARGVRTVLIVSILCGGRLWGYLWCESRRPHPVGLHVRALFEGLGEIAAAQIGALEERTITVLRSAANRGLARMGRLLREHASLIDGIAAARTVLGEILPHDQMAISMDGRSWSSGGGPSPAHWLRLLDAAATGRRDGLRWIERAAGSVDQDEIGMADVLDIELHGSHLLLLRQAGRRWSPLELEVAQELHHLLADRHAELYRRRTEQQLHKLANFDRTTGLPNRDHLLRALEQALAVGMEVAVAVIGLDRFRYVKAALGEAASDQLLAAVGQRLRGAVSAGDLLARIDTGEFAVLLVEDGAARFDALAAAVRDALRTSFPLEDREIFVTGSLGVVTHCGKEEAAAEMLRDAEIASAEAEAAGGGGRRVFDAAMRARLTERHDLYDRLRQAIQGNDGVRVVYQPIIRLSDGKLAGFEALARWTDPERGPIPPTIFVPVAEETGLIVPLGNHILVQACRQVVRWNRDRQQPIYVSVNLSPYQLDPSRLDIARWVQGVLEMTGCKPEWLHLEITESGLIGSGGAAPGALKSLRALGVALAIDDFGTGYSSLAYLQELPVDTIKIDRSFVTRMEGSEKGLALVSAILHIAGIMEYGVVAEGVENPAQASLLREMGCDRAQGYHYAKPLEQDMATAMVYEYDIGANGLPSGASATA